MHVLTTCNRHTSLYDLSKMRFYHICNGVIQYASDSFSNTDESHCSSSEWPCETYHLKCDQLWNCANGHDELEYFSITRIALSTAITPHIFAWIILQVDQFAYQHRKLVMVSLIVSDLGMNEHSVERNIH